MNYFANFIKAGEEYTTAEKSVPAPYLRKSFDITEIPEQAELFITGIGFYDVYINGEKITKGYLAPYRSNLDDYIYYDKYELSDKLVKGKNTLGIILGNGMLNSIGGYVWNFSNAPFRGAPQTAFALVLKNGDGEQLVLSDTDVKTAPSPILFDDVHYGEVYDARLEISEWNMPDFDDSGWKNAVKALPPRGELKLCEADPIRELGSHAPVSVTRFEDSFIYDFGITSAGVCRLKIKGSAGQRISLRFFEDFRNGRPCTEALRCNREDERYQNQDYILSGKGIEEHTPHFTYYGFRYVQVFGITDEQAKEELLTFLELGSDIEIIGGFSTDNEVVNKIQEMTVRSDRSNFYYFPTDCPQREKNGWTGDISLSSEQLCLNMSAEKSFKEWLHNVYKAMKPDGRIPGIVPTVEWGYEGCNGPSWDSAMINIPYYCYIYRGDREIIEELSTPLMRYLNYLFSRRDERGLLNIGIGDWCQPHHMDGAHDTPNIVTNTADAYLLSKKAEFIFGELNQIPQKQFAEAFSESIRRSFRKYLIDKATLTVESGTQTAQAIAIHYGLFDEDERERAFNVLLDIIKKDNNSMNVGVIGLRAIFRVLCDFGYEDLALDMVIRPEFPSYGEWVSRGYTALPEAFFPEGGHLVSLNHHFWGDISAWFYTYLAGLKINPKGRDTANVNIKPCFVKKLNRVNAFYNTPCGKIEVSWERKNGDIVINISAASAIHGLISLPAGYVFEDGSVEKPLASGEFTVKAPR